MRQIVPLAVVVALAGMGDVRAQEPATMKIPAPEMEGISDWVNSKGYKLGDLKGKVVVLHFWAFG